MISMEILKTALIFPYNPWVIMVKVMATKEHNRGIALITAIIILGLLAAVGGIAGSILPDQGLPSVFWRSSLSPAPRIGNHSALCFSSSWPAPW